MSNKNYFKEIINDFKLDGYDTQVYSNNDVDFGLIYNTNSDKFVYYGSHCGNCWIKQAFDCIRFSFYDGFTIIETFLNNKKVLNDLYCYGNERIGIKYD